MAPRKEALTRRTMLVNQITEMHEVAVNAVTEPHLRPLFKIRFKFVETLFSDFMNIHIEISNHTAEVESREQDDIRKKFEQMYYEILLNHEALFPSAVNSEASLSLSTPSPGNINIRLPKVALRTFNGEFSEWNAFIQSFNATIHNNSDISPIDKFTYLLGVLSSEPLNLVKSLMLTAENYPIAYKTLVDRYDDKRKLASQFYQSLMNIPKLQTESSKGLRQALDRFKEYKAALYALNISENLEDFLWFNLLFDKLDNDTKRAFEIDYRSNKNAFPTFERLETFIESQCRILDTACSSKEPRKQFSSSTATFGRSYSRPMTNAASSLVSTAAFGENTCPLCSEFHNLHNCSEFQQKSPLERSEIVRQNRCCSNCLRPSHATKTCNSRYSCKICRRKHHTLLHFVQSPSNSLDSNPSEQVMQQPQSNHPAQFTTCASQSSTSSLSNTVLLGTMCVEISDRSGNFHSVRALIDPASQASYIVAHCAQRLGLRRHTTCTPISGLGHISTTSTYVVRIQIRPTGTDRQPLDLESYILPRICGNLPNMSVTPPNPELLSNFKLADPLWYQSRPVELLLGADIYPSIALDANLVPHSGLPFMLNTIFGWVLLGPVNTSPSAPIQTLCASIGPSIDQTLRNFWEIEEVPTNQILSPEDELAELSFKDSLFRNSSGRFGVSLPFKSEMVAFNGSKGIADRRFLALENRLLKQPTLYHLYVDFMRDYLNSGHMSLVPNDPYSTDSYYIPHHGVLKVENGKSKIRVVFDASAKDRNQLSLNDTLLVGGKLQNDIVSLLLRFRSEPVVFTCDVRQMYRQILISPEHRRFQLIRWRFSPHDPLETYQLNTVTYGVSSAPFLAIRTLLELAKVGESQFPLAAEAIRSNLYVDDLICSSRSVENALDMQRQLIQLFALGCFELRKWSSNHPDLLETVPADHQQIRNLSFDNDSSLKILGLQWQSNSDHFTFNVEPRDTPCTKRLLLSEIARIYDPVGFICPVSFFAKRVIQHLWVLGLDWDGEPPSDVISQWNRFKAELPCLSSLKIPRLLIPQEYSTCELHGFCDASEAGYAASVYFRFTLTDSSYLIHLIVAKSKVSPLKRLSIPRLELCSATLLAKLIKFVMNSYAKFVEIEKIYCWTDSTVVLNWIRSFPHCWKTFVANRISYIHERVPPECWRHVPSAENPADLASRGLFPGEISTCSLWWAGPPFLSLPCDSWPTEPVVASAALTGVDLEARKITLVAQTSRSIVLDLLDKFSSLRKIQGIISYTRLFIDYRLKRLNSIPTSLSNIELYQSLMVIAKTVQHEVFSEFITKLNNNQPLPKWLAKLSPFLDAEQILRVGGRIRNSNLSFSAKHPALLPKKHRFTELLINQIHTQNFHSGINTTLYLAQQNFWILSSRRAIRSYLSKCNHCFRVNPTPFIPPMGNLPTARVTQVKPFSRVGCDFAGPFSITMNRRRGAKTTKAYLCLFVCFATKALHLELASSLSTEVFLAALRRFIARRGRCSQIFSDCGSNFVGANRELSRMLRHVAETEGITWSFNPPSAPHFGGIWESGVKSVKTHLQRVIGKQILTYEELNTVFIQIEAMLNSRPLCALSSDPNDMSSLTPGHFLVLEPPTTAPDPDLTHLQISRLSRWQLIQQLQQGFWHRWHNEYLHNLYQKSKWATSKALQTADIGTLVLIKEELSPPLKWKLGRIVEIFPGGDGVARVASVYTNQDTIKRPMVKLCALPTQ